MQKFNAGVDTDADTNADANTDADADADTWASSIPFTSTSLRRGKKANVPTSYSHVWSSVKYKMTLKVKIGTGSS